jgi:hypothetical protein
MLEWVSGRVATTFVVLVIAVSFLGLFGMQVDYYRTLELEDLADAISELVTEVDLLNCEAWVEVNWSSASEPHGLPRDFHGGTYIVQFTEERPHVSIDGTRVSGMYFPSPVELVDADGDRVELLEVSSATGFVVCSRPSWTEHGLDHPITLRALG